MRKLLVINHMTLDGVMQAPGRPDEDTRGGFSRGGWAQAGNDEVMARYLAPYGELVTDGLGSIVARRDGAGADAPRILVAGHMDEVGYMVTLIDDNGYKKPAFYVVQKILRSIKPLR